MRWLPIALVVLWPLAYFARFVLPGLSFSSAIGNDFVLLYYSYKVYLLDFLQAGRFPLWSPSEAAGFPFYSNPFTQAFYPLNIPLALCYRVFGGYSVLDHQIFTVLGVSVYGLGLFLWLSQCVSGKRAVLFGTLITLSSYKLGEILRFPNAVHTAAWMPWLLYGLTLALEDGRRLRSGVVLFVSALMILTAGYPYYVYYCLFLIPPYIVFLLIPYTRRGLMLSRDTPFPGPKKYLLRIGIPLLLPAIVCTPYMLKMFQLLRATAGRPARDYEYATAIVFDPINSLGALVFPPASQVEGSYYFGVLGVILIIVFAAGCLLDRRQSPLRSRFFLLAFGWFAVVSYISYGKQSYLFDLLWTYLPGFASLRAWGRINIILLPILALLLSRAYEYFEGLLGSSSHVEVRRAALAQLAVVTVSGLVIATIQSCLDAPPFRDPYWVLGFAEHHGQEYLFRVATLAAQVLVIALIAYSIRWPLRRSGALWVVLVLCLAFSVADVHRVGSRQWATKPEYDLTQRAPLRMREAIAHSLTVPRLNHYWTIARDSRFNAGYIPYWYFRSYVTFHHRVSDPHDIFTIVNLKEWPWFQRIMGLNDGQRFFVSRSVDHHSIGDFVRDADNTSGSISPQVTVRKYDGDRLICDVNTTQPLFFTFVDNWDPDWRAYVNDAPVPIHKTLGTFKAVKLEPGHNRVVFSYKPFLWR